MSTAFRALSLNPPTSNISIPISFVEEDAGFSNFLTSIAKAARSSPITKVPMSVVS